MAEPGAPTRVPTWLPTLLIVSLALASSLAALGNTFTFDDLPIIRDNPAVHTLAVPWRFFIQPYWPKSYSGDLYRPVTVLAFALQWALGSARPLLFHLVSVLLYLATCLMFYRLAARLLPPLGAWTAGALFAAHPVHVEATAIAVGQAEIGVALLAMTAVDRYLSYRAKGPITSGQASALSGLFLLACLVKENAIALPGLLLAAEISLVDERRPLRRRVAELWRLGLALALVAILFLTVRSAVLHDIVGTFTAEAFRGAGTGGRLLTMLAVVPQWTRLLLWPAHLQADYSPREIEAAIGWGPPQVLGLALLLGSLALTVAAFRRAPAVCFGLLWTAVALLPVSNVLVPTGIVLAERTLFLPSAGILLVVGALAAIAGEPRHSIRPGLRYLAATALGAVLLAGAWRSAGRQAVWQDPLTLYRQTVIDAPRSYRAYWGLGDILFAAGERGTAERLYRTAIQLYPDQYRIYEDLGNHYLSAGLCLPAIAVYRQALGLQPDQWDIRTELIACLLKTGAFAEALSQARVGIVRGVEVETFRRFEGVAARSLRTGVVPRVETPADSLPAGR